MPYGTTFSKSAAEDIIRGSNVYKNRVADWTNILTSGIAQSNLAYQTEAASQTSAFGSAMSEAYKSSQLQQSRWQGSGLGQYSTQKYMGMEKENLVNLYNQYIGRYSENITKLGEQTTTAQQKLLNDYMTNMTEQEKLTSEYGKNYASIMNLAYDWISEEGQFATKSENMYLEDGSLDYKYEGTGKKRKIATDEQGNESVNQKETNYLDSQGMDWLFTGEGDNRILLSRSQINNILLDKDNKLTARGDQFFDFLLNMVMEHGYEVDSRAGMTYDEWLSGKDSKLHDWIWEADEFADIREDGKIQTRLDTLRGMTGVTGDEYDKRRHTLDVALDKTAESPAFLENEIKDYAQKEFIKDATLEKSLVEGIEYTATHKKVSQDKAHVRRVDYVGDYVFNDPSVRHRMYKNMIALSKEADARYTKKIEKINEVISDKYGIDISKSKVYADYKDTDIEIITGTNWRSKYNKDVSSIYFEEQKLERPSDMQKLYDKLFADIKAADERIDEYQKAIAKYILNKD